MRQDRCYMVNTRTDHSISKVLDTLKEHPEGLSITDLAVLLSMNRNSASKYLDILQRQGSIDMRQIGVAKIYYPTRRLPVAAVRRFCSQNLIVVDHNLEILEVSDTLAGLIGMLPEVLTGKPVQDLFFSLNPSDDIILSLRRALRGEEETFIWHLPGTGGSNRRIFLIPTVLESGRPAVSLVIEELRETGGTEEARHLKTLREKALQEDQIEGIVRVSPDGCVRWTNDAYCRVTGKSREEIIGRVFRPLLIAGGGAAWREFVRSLTPGNPTATIDCEMIVPDGSVQWYRWRGRALCDADGRVIEYQYLCFSIHECRMLEDSLRWRQQSLEEQMSTRTAALREREEWFRAIFEESPVGIAFCNRDSTVLHVNQAFATIFGVKNREEMVGRNVASILNTPREMLQRLKGGAAVRFTVPYSGKEDPHLGMRKTESPETICLDGVASPISGEDGVSSGFVLQLCNVTERKKAEDAVKKAESRYRNLLEALAEGVVYLGADGRIIDANPVTERILGYSLSEMRGRTCGELRWRVLCEDDSECTKDLLPHTTALATGIPERKTLGIFNPRERRYHWLDTLAIPRFRPGDAKPFQIVVVFSDITGQREVEEMHRETENRYRTLVESLPDVVFLLDPEGHVLHVNAPGVRMLHRLSEEVIGKELPDLFPDDPGEEYRRSIASAVATGTIKTSVNRLQLPDGETWYDTRFIPVRAQDGTCRQVMGVARDITAQMRAEETSRKNAGWFRSIYEDSPIGIAVCDPEGLLLHANRACLELFGISREDEIRGTGLREVCRKIGNDDVQVSGNTATPFECLLDFDQVANQGLLPTARTGSIHIGGVIRPLRSQEGGLPEGYLVQVRDVTTRVLAEGALRESHDHLARIARHLPDAMFAIDQKEVVTVWNLAMEDLTGIPAEEMLGKGNYEYALPFYGQRVPMLINKVLKPDQVIWNRYRSITYAEGNGITAETMLSPNHGDTPRLWWLKAVPLYDGQGEVVGAIESIRDVTEQRLGEEVLRKEKTFASTAHEILRRIPALNVQEHRTWQNSRC
ncbi:MULTISPECIES: PAS domain-containing protein [unclassified Methanoculleus]|uniref:PAS domain-containing protein n=2 Tax=unclassified Methanoculleus TaxID=2619537 RepID=UPI00319DF39F